jgi:phosphatidylglycerol:prolipoprotein diacylglycerol transferase
VLVHPQFDPVAIHLGPLAVRWYGLTYLIGFGLIWLAGRYAIRTRAHSVWNNNDLDDALFYGILGTILGGRFGYVLFYKFSEYLAEPWRIFYVWEGGMSFHGGVLGFVAGMLWFARRTGRGFFVCCDFLVPVVPIGLGLGRIANFINQELWGAPTLLPWGVLFTNPAAGGVPRHPSQLYEAFLEGLVLFFVLAWVRRRSLRAGEVSASFLVVYAVFRIAVEFVREPDPQLGYLWGGWLTMGQVLCLPMIAVGVGIFIWSRGAAALPADRN